MKTKKGLENTKELIEGTMKSIDLSTEIEIDELRGEGKKIEATLFKPTSAIQVRQLSPRIHLNASPSEPNGQTQHQPSEEKKIIKVLIAETTIPGFLDILLSIVHRRRGDFGNVMFSMVSVHDPNRFNHELVKSHMITFVEDKFLLELTAIKSESRSNVILLATETAIDKHASIAEQKLIENGFDMTDRVDLQAGTEQLLEAHVISILLKRINIDV